MDHFIDFFENIKNAVLLSSSDSEEERAKKIMWYAFFGALFMIIVISYFIFVTFTFSFKGVKVPNIEGDTIYTALKKLSDKELVVRVFPKYMDEYPEGIVYSQNPSQGTFVKRGRTITINVSMGKRGDALPDFAGMSLFDVAAYLDRSYPDGKIPYKFGEKNYEFSSTVDKGRVIKQSPAEGTPLASVKSVKLWISNGIKTRDTHVIGNYTGKKLAAVLKELAALEVSADLHFTEVSKKNEDGIITGQSAAPGSLADELIKNGKVISIACGIYLDHGNDRVQGEMSVRLPKKNIMYKLTVYTSEMETDRNVIFSMYTTGGYSFTLPYSQKKFTKLYLYAGDTLLQELTAQDGAPKN